MKSFLQGVLFFFGSLLQANSQRICGTTLYKQQLVASNPVLKGVFGNIEKQVASVNNSATVALRDTNSNEIIYIPVVIHVLYNGVAENISDAQIKSQLESLNNDFRMLNSDRVNTPKPFKSSAGDARIQFCLARVDPQGKNTTGIERKYTSQLLFSTDDGMKLPLRGGLAAWDSKHYLNIWVCKLSSNSVGYATPPGTAPELDGVVIAYDAFGTMGTLRPVFNKGRTATHEIGHWLGLLHTWGDENCGDDKVEDTPAQQSFNYGCPAFPKLSSCSPDNNGDMFMNFMDFSDDACMSLFTKGQVKRMRAIFAQGGVRNAFLASFACDSALAPASSLPIVSGLPSRAISLESTKVYPTPVLSAATIDCKAASATSLKTLVIYDCLGVKVRTVTLSREKTILNLENLVPGVYIFQIADGHDTFTTKIIRN